jgi:putative flippase GtrA
MAQCSQCVEERAGASAAWFAGVSTALTVVFRYLLGMLRWTPPAAEGVAREILLSGSFFVSMYIWSRWWFHSRHLPRTRRTRYLLARLGWFALIVVGLGALALLLLFLLMELLDLLSGLLGFR